MSFHKPYPSPRPFTHPNNKQRSHREPTSNVKPKALRGRSRLEPPQITSQLPKPRDRRVDETDRTGVREEKNGGHPQRRAYCAHAEPRFKPPAIWHRVRREPWNRQDDSWAPVWQVPSIRGDHSGLQVHLIETTGSRLAIEGVEGCRASIDNLLRDGGGVLFIDEAYQLIDGSGSLGKHVLEFLVAEVENLTGKMVFILAGYKKKMEKLLAHNQGLSERFPCRLNFEDFDDAELMQIMESWIRKTWGDNMVVEDGLGGLYCRIAARRIGRLRGQDGFANARAVENVMARVCERQSKRLSQSIAQGGDFDHFFLDKQDMLGPDPSLALRSSKAMQRLHDMTGLNAVKSTVQGLLNTVQYNYRRELNEQPLVEYSLNKVFLGNPGTGKTSVAKIYGQILVDIGLLSNGEGMQGMSHQVQQIDLVNKNDSCGQKPV